MRHLRYLLIIVSFSALIASCTKEGPEGPVGGIGPQGIPGSNGSGGTKGQIGDTGPQGPAGTANVVYSSWIPSPAVFAPTGWADTTLPVIGLVSRANLSAPSLSQTILDQGFTVVYHTFAAAPSPPTGGANAQSLPYTTTASGLILQVNYKPAVGRVIVFIKNLTTSASFGLLGGHYFRYVLIPGNIAGGRMMNGPAAGFSTDELKNMTYEQLIKKFNIPYNGSNVD